MLKRVGTFQREFFVLKGTSSRAPELAESASIVSTHTPCFRSFVRFRDGTDRAKLFLFFLETKRVVFVSASLKRDFLFVKYALSAEKSVDHVIVHDQFMIT